MEIIFTIIVVAIIGLFVRGALGEENIDINKSNWVGQVIICIIIGSVVWFAIPKSCTHTKNDHDPADTMILRR